jgi:hypothetical protein
VCVFCEKAKAGVATFMTKRPRAPEFLCGSEKLRC